MRRGERSTVRDVANLDHTVTPFCQRSGPNERLPGFDIEILG
jgi:hypothetical protein